MAPASRNVRKVSIFDHTNRLHKSERNNDDDVNERKHRERVAEGAMNHMPQVKYVLRAREEGNSLGQRSLGSCDADGPLQLLVRCAKQSTEVGQHPSPAQRSDTH